MKSSKSTTKDIFISSLIIIIFLIFGSVLNDPFGLYYDSKFGDLIYSLPSFIALVPFIGIATANIYFAIIANTKNRKMLFKSAIIFTFLSLLSHIVALLTPNDSNPLILLFIPVALVFYPFGFLFEPSFSGIEYYLWDYAYLFVLVTMFIIPLVTYFSIKAHYKKKRQNSNTYDKIDLTENKD